jgi:hypothetical protein
MKPTIPVSVFAAFFLATLPAFPNGGGYSRGGVENTGTVAGFEPSGTEHVRILDEQLNVWLGPYEAEVEVRYIMRNESKKRVKVRFGFPVEESSDGWMLGETGTPQKRPKYCRDYRIAAGGKPIKAVFEPEKEKTDKRFRGLAGWLVSETTFGGDEEKSVTISFRSLYPVNEDFVSSNSRYSPHIFRYRLSTGACWAGTIASGKVTLRPKGIAPSELRVIKPVNRFSKHPDGSWVWEFENLEPSLADDIEAEAVPEIHSYDSEWNPDAKRKPGAKQKPNERVSFMKRGNQWFMGHRNYTVKASSTLPPERNHHYDAGNINDGNWGNTWAEGAPGPGRGEWLEIRPAVPKPLVALKLLPGYAIDSDSFHANARPKTIKVELNGEYSFTAQISDPVQWMNWQWQWIPVQGYDKTVKTVKITFEDVWKGTRYEDLCVSGVELVVKLDKKPKIRPCR